MATVKEAVLSVHNKLKQRIQKKQHLSEKIAALESRINVVTEFLELPRDDQRSFESFVEQKGLNASAYILDDEKIFGFCPCLATGQHPDPDTFEDQLENYLVGLEKEQEQCEDEWEYLDTDEAKLRYVIEHDSNPMTAETNYGASGNRKAERKARREARRKARQEARAKRKKAKEDWKKAGKPGGRKAFRKTKQGIRKERLEIQRRNAGFIRKAWNLNKKAALQPNRLSFLALLEINMFNMAYRMRELKESNLAADNDKWRLMKEKWQWTFGGNPAKLEKVMMAGSRKKAARTKSEAESLAVPVKSANGEYGIAPPVLAAMIAAASTVIVAITPILAGGKGQGEVGGEGFGDAMKLVAKNAAIDQINKSNLSQEAKDILIGRINAGENPEDVTYDALDEELGEGIPEWVWWVGGVALIGTLTAVGIAMYRHSKNKSKTA